MQFTDLNNNESNTQFLLSQSFQLLLIHFSTSLTLFLNFISNKFSNKKELNPPIPTRKRKIIYKVQQQNTTKFVNRKATRFREIDPDLKSYLYKIILNEKYKKKYRQTLNPSSNPSFKIQMGEKQESIMKIEYEGEGEDRKKRRCIKNPF